MAAAVGDGDEWIHGQKDLAGPWPGGQKLSGVRHREEAGSERGDEQQREGSRPAGTPAPLSACPTTATIASAGSAAGASYASAGPLARTRRAC